jgi:phosphopantetheinyl transferase
MTYALLAAAVDDVALNDPLYPEELALLGAQALPKRRAEWSAGRRLAERALAAHMGAEPPAFAILRDGGETRGRPYAVLHETGARVPLHVSITHADGVAAACAAPFAVGLDLVRLEDLGAAFESEAFATGELATWLAASPGARTDIASVAFAAKESVLKWAGVGMGVSLTTLRVTPAPFVSSARGPHPLRVTVDGPTMQTILHGWLWRSAERALVLLSAVACDNAPTVTCVGSHLSSY